MEAAVYGNRAEHPDFALLRHPDRHAICCLVLENGDMQALDALEPLHAFHVFVQDGLTAVLLALPGEESFLDNLRERLEKNGLCAGLSGPFALTASAHGCMRKAQIALETGRRLAPGRALYPMDEFGEAALLMAAGEALRGAGYAPCDFCEAAIGQMRCLDRETGTQYASSLHAYLAHGRDLKRAAEALGVHRNTLAYRMKRVQELFDVDLQDVNTCFELLFSFWLCDGLGGGECAHRDHAAFDARAAEAALFACLQRRAGEELPLCAGFGCRMLCVSVSAIRDEDRIKLLGLLRGYLPKEAACAFDDELMLFAVDPQAFDAFEAAALPQCRLKGCRSVSTQAFDASRLYWRVQLCRMALRAAGRIHVRTRDMVSTLLFMTLESRFSLAPYLCEDVIRVMDDDAKRGSSLSQSLYAYLLNFRDMKRAAQQLDMHRNTMEYHMRKIDALIGREPGEKRRFLMMCTYKMLALPDMHQ